MVLREWKVKVQELPGAPLTSAELDELVRSSEDWDALLEALVQSRLPARLSDRVAVRVEE